MSNGRTQQSCVSQHRGLVRVTRLNETKNVTHTHFDKKRKTKNLSSVISLSFLILFLKIVD